MTRISNFGRNFKFFREKARLGQEALANEVGVNVRTISLYENGKGFPKVDLLLQISKVLNVPVEHFFVEDPESIKSQKVDVSTQQPIFNDDINWAKLKEYRGLVHAYRQFKDNPNQQIFEKCISTLDQILDDLESAYVNGKDFEGKLDYATQIIHTLTMRMKN